MTEDIVRVVLAEDDFLVAAELKRCLKGSRYRLVAEVSDGEKAVEKVIELKPDVAVLDIKMPKKDGIEAAMEIQASCPTPVVFLTAYESAELVESASKAGAGAYLTKPPRFQELDRAMTLAMARHRDLMELRRMNEALLKANKELIEAQSEIQTLQGLLPICSFCKRIRDDGGYWRQLEAYITARTGVLFSHGICPHCLEKNYPELADKLKEDGSI